MYRQMPNKQSIMAFWFTHAYVKNANAGRPFYWVAKWQRASQNVTAYRRLDGLHYAFKDTSFSLMAWAIRRHRVLWRGHIPKCYWYLMDISTVANDWNSLSSIERWCISAKPGWYRAYASRPAALIALPPMAVAGKMYRHYYTTEFTPERMSAR